MFLFSVFFVSFVSFVSFVFFVSFVDKKRRLAPHSFDFDPGAMSEVEEQSEV